MCVTGAPRGQKRVLDLQDLEHCELWRCWEPNPLLTTEPSL